MCDRRNDDLCERCHVSEILNALSVIDTVKKELDNKSAKNNHENMIKNRNKAFRKIGEFLYKQQINSN